MIGARARRSIVAISLVAPVARIKRAELPRGAYAYSLVPVKGFGVLASIFWRRVEKMAKGLRVFQGLYLGHLFAHEIGHLLLADGGHSAAGIMSKEWDLHVLSYATQRKLLFGPRQAEKMRAQVMERVRSSASTEADLGQNRAENRAGQPSSTG